MNNMTRHFRPLMTQKSPCVSASASGEGAGVARTCLMGHHMAEWINGMDSEELRILRRIATPSHLPPEPLPTIGATVRLAWEEFNAKPEIWPPATLVDNMEFFYAPKAAPAGGPYSHAVKAGNTWYLSGQVPFHPVTGEVVGVNMTEQAAQTLANMKVVLDGCGLSINDIAKVTVFITDMHDFDAFNAVYADFMGAHRPARVCVAVSNIAHGCLLEVDCVCVRD